MAAGGKGPTWPKQECWSFTARHEEATNGMSKQSKRHALPKRHPHPGNGRVVLETCGVPGCLSLQNEEHMDKVIVVHEVPGGMQAEVVKACRKHSDAFAGIIPSLKVLTDQAYSGRPIYLHVGEDGRLAAPVEAPAAPRAIVPATSTPSAPGEPGL
jgi:hypothetical protein